MQGRGERESDGGVSDWLSANLLTKRKTNKIKRKYLDVKATSRNDTRIDGRVMSHCYLKQKSSPMQTHLL